MNPTASRFQAAHAAPPGDVLCIRRGDAEFWIPCERIGGIVGLGEVAPLPCAERWVVGLAAHAGHPLPVVDLAICAGACPPRYKVAVLFADADGEPVAMALADGPGRLAKVPAGLRKNPSSRHIARILGTAYPAWWVEAGRLIEDLKE